MRAYVRVSVRWSFSIKINFISLVNETKERVKELKQFIYKVNLDSNRRD